jgi:hypothetical protein
LLKGLAGIRTTHNPAVMLAHDKHGYPDDFVSNAEPNGRLQPIRIPLNPAVDDAEFQHMLVRGGLSAAQRAGLSLATVQAAVYDSYWKLGGLTEADAWAPLLGLGVGDLRRLLHPEASATQGVHECESARL